MRKSHSAEQLMGAGEVDGDGEDGRKKRREEMV